MVTGEYRIATFNLENLDDEDEIQFEERKKVLQPMMERINADLLLLQEVNKLQALDKLIEGTIYQNYHEEHTLTKSGVPMVLETL